MCAAGHTSHTMYGTDFPEELIDQVAALIHGAGRVVVFTGAGISTDSGIPDFRGPEGLWTKDPKAEQTSNIHYYLNEPEVRKAAWKNRVRNWDRKLEPNGGHRAVTTLHGTGKLHAVITQNVDGLHQSAGIPDDIVWELHGTVMSAHCWECKDRRPMAEFIERVKAGEEDPACELCGGIVKSDTILFGEALVPEVLTGAMSAAGSCDLLLVVGSTLGVSPANNAVPRARAAGAHVVIVNGGPTEMDHHAHVLVNGSITAAMEAIVAAVARLAP
ncbi:MAG: NAD-dependent deacetylase [Actinomycetota bacterium]